MVDSDPTFLGTILAKRDKDNSIVSVLSVKTEPGSKVGDNYASVIVRATLKVILGSGKLATRKVILKKALTEVPKEIKNEMNGAFTLEGIVYEKIMSVYETLIAERSLPYPKFWADCFYTSKELIIFDDLKASGFTLASRHSGLDPEHAKIVFTNLARLHALSVVAVADGYVYPKILPPYMMAESGIGESFFRASMKSLANVIRDSWGPKWSLAEKKIRILMDEIIPTLKKLYNESYKLPVINHGDCWVNNMMFKYDNQGSPIDLKFVDLQISYYNSYGWDLTYFLHSSVHPKHLIACKQELIEIYSREFAANLELLGHDVLLAPTVQDINGELKRLQPFSLAVSTSILPVTANPSDIKISLEEMLDEESTKFRELFENKEFEKTIQAMIEHLMNEGVFS